VKPFEVSVVITHLDRPDLLEQCVAHLRPALDGMGHEVLVADDGSADEVVTRILALEGVTVLTSAVRRGLGANANRAITVANGDHLLYVQDDHRLAPDATSVLREAIAVLDAYPDIDLVRLEGPDLRASEVRHLDGLEVRILDPRVRANGLRALELYSDWPHLVRRRFHDHDVGLYVEGRPMGVTELEFAFRFRARGATAAVIAGREAAFVHVGGGRSSRMTSTREGQRWRRPFADIKRLAAYGIYRATDRFPFSWYGDGPGAGSVEVQRS